MFLAHHTDDAGWSPPKIVPFQTLQVHPAAQVLHYGICCFEGMKAYTGSDGRGRLFRCALSSALSTCLPLHMNLAGRDVGKKLQLSAGSALRHRFGFDSAGANHSPCILLLPQATDEHGAPVQVCAAVDAGRL